MNRLIRPSIIQLKSNKDIRGKLVAIEGERTIPFAIKRVFYIKNMDELPRGFHAHKECEQVLVAVQGSFGVELDDGETITKWHLDNEESGLYFPTNHWLKMEKFSGNCVIMVLCSSLYDENEYIRNYGDFLAHVKKIKDASQQAEATIKLFDLSQNTKQIREAVDQRMSTIINNQEFVMGKEVALFEKNFAAYNKVEYCVAVSNGTSALSTAIKSLNLPLDTEIIVPANTYIAAAIAIDYCFFKVKVVDVDESLNLDLDLLEQSLTEKTRVVIVVHLYGNCCDMNRLMSLKKKYNFYVIEDAAQAHGSEFQGRKLGTIGDIGCFSFYPSKNLGAWGEGGAVVTHDENIYKTIRLLRNYGCEERYKWLIKGSNERMHNLQAAVLNVKLQYLDTWNEARIKLSKIYDEKLGQIAKIIIPPRNATVCNFHLYVIKADDRDELIKFLKQNGIDTGIHYPQPFYRSEAYKELSEVMTKQLGENYSLRADDASKKVLSLPMYPELSDEKVERVCEYIKRFYDSKVSS